MSHPDTFTVFYAWHSDLPREVNQSLIRSALNAAGAALTGDAALNLRVVIDESVRGTTGSADICDSIIQKIRTADAFVCDITKVAQVKNETGDVRKFWNANVAIELGYALRTHGWDRIILVFNEAYGVLNDDFPFDVQGHFAHHYRCSYEVDEKGKPNSVCESIIKNAVGQLRSTLKDALKEIYAKNPKRPADVEGLSENTLKRLRDLEHLRRVLYWVSPRVMDDFIDRLHNNGRLTHVGTDFCDAVSEQVQSLRFHFYDAELRTRVGEFISAWQDCSRYAYDMEANAREAYFHMPMDCPKSAEQMKQFEYTRSMALPLREKLSRLFEYIRQHYVEIDLAQCGEQAIAARLEK